MLGKFFDKVKQGLAQTRQAMTNVIAGNPRLDDDAIDDIEAALIGADMGIETATELVDGLRERLRSGQMVDGPDGVMQVLEEQVAAMMTLGNGATLPLAGELPGKPFVVLIVGVNGTGKTTTVGKLAKQYADAGKKVVLAAGRHVPGRSHSPTRHLGRARRSRPDTDAARSGSGGRGL